MEELNAPLLVASTGAGSEKSLSLSLSLPHERPNRNTVTALRSDFLSKLPEKVRSGVDSESPFHVDVSKATGLIEGEFPNCAFSVSLFQ